MKIHEIICLAILMAGLVARPGTTARGEESPEARSAAAGEAAPPIVKGRLMNEKCPITGEPAKVEFFLPYADAENEVFGRIHFDSAEVLEKAKSSDPKALYIKGYLTKPDGTTAEYGRPRLDIRNRVCPVMVHKMAGFNFKINYNASAVWICCKKCLEPFLADPDKSLHNVNNEVDSALAKLKARQDSKKDGAKP